MRVGNLCLKLGKRLGSKPSSDRIVTDRETEVASGERKRASERPSDLSGDCEGLDRKSIFSGSCRYETRWDVLENIGSVCAGK